MWLVEDGCTRCVEINAYAGRVLEQVGAKVALSVDKRIQKLES